MNVYRLPPAVLPSLRPLPSANEAFYRAVVAVLYDGADESWTDDAFRWRAEAAPCPPAPPDATPIPHGSKLPYMPPPPTRRPGPGRVVFE